MFYRKDHKVFKKGLPYFIKNNAMFPVLDALHIFCQTIVCFQV